MLNQNDGRVRRLGYMHARSDGKVDFKTMSEPCSTKVLTELNEIITVVFELQPVIFAFQIVERNHAALHSTLQDQQVELETYQYASFEKLHDALVDTARQVTNFLASVSSFLDQTDALIKRIWGEKSLEAAAWKRKTHDLYDLRFSYRFLYQLRHFAQHTALPLTDIAVKGKRSSAEKPMAFDITVPITRDALLNETFKWKPEVRSEIEGQPDSFLLLPLIDEHMDSVGRLCLEVIDLQSPRLLECVRYMEAVNRTLQAPQGALPVLVVGNPPSLDQATKLEFIPMAELNRVIRVYNERKTSSAELG
ncbi:MAG: hypothetical protein AAF362_14645 [Pseudomonadota bacterium]